MSLFLPVDGLVVGAGLSGLIATNNVVHIPLAAGRGIAIPNFLHYLAGVAFSYHCYFSFQNIKFGGPSRVRTEDLEIMSHVLCRLS